MSTVELTYKEPLDHQYSFAITVTYFNHESSSQMGPIMSIKILFVITVIVVTKFNCIFKILERVKCVKCIPPGSLSPSHT